MADPVWGVLAKAQDDPTTIDEAIAQAIADHNDDPEAHIGTGQSLELHRTNDVVDHPQASILMDKYSSKEGYFSNSFQTLTGFQQLGDVSNAGWPGVTLSVDDGGTETSRIRCTPLVPGGFLREGKDAILDFSAYADTVGTTYELYMGYGASTETPDAGFGFVRVSEETKGYVKVGSTIEYTDDLETDWSTPHTFRAYYSGAEDIVYYYVDGVEVAQIERPAGTWDISPWLSFGANANGEESGVIQVLQINFSADLTP